MKNIFTFFAVILFCGWAQAQGEHEMIVEPTAVGILDQTIIGDTSATGERNDPERVYVLRRGAPYLIGQTLDAADYHLRIKAEEGDGAKPILIFDVGDGGETPSQMFVVSSGGHLTLDGIHVAGQDIIGNYVSRLIRINGDKSKVVIDNCFLDESSQSGFRLNADSIKVFISNTIVTRMGQFNSPDNGRFLDNRGHPLDTLWVYNCVVYDVTSRIYRHGNDNAYLHHAFFDQNTFFGSGQWGLSFSPADELSFTNNIVANPVFLGFTDSIPRYAITIDTFREGDLVDISYNNFFTNPEFDAALPAVAPNTGDTVKSVNGAYFGPQISNAMMASASSTTNINEVLEFANAPNIQQDLIDNTYDSTATIGGWDFSDLSADAVYSAIGGLGIDRYTEFHDFSYSENTTSFTAGNNGQKLGADLTNLGTAIKEDFFVRDNILYYPNPVENQLFIQNLDKAELSLIQIYDLRGVPIQQQRVKGDKAVFNLPNLPTGTYVLTIRDSAGKVSSRKLIKN
jgi:hypothetical protein